MILGLPSGGEGREVQGQRNRGLRRGHEGQTWG